MANLKTEGSRTLAYICVVIALIWYVALFQVPRDQPLPADLLDRLPSLAGELFLPTALLIVGVYLLIRRKAGTVAM